MKNSWFGQNWRGEDIPANTNDEPFWQTALGSACFFFAFLVLLWLG